jgi:hypothetical protein
MIGQMYPTEYAKRLGVKVVADAPARTAFYSAKWIQGLQGDLRAGQQVRRLQRHLRRAHPLEDPQPPGGRELSVDARRNTAVPRQ